MPEELGVDQIIDTHAHLEDIPDLDRAIARAEAAGVIKILAMSMDLRSAQFTLRASEQFPGKIFPALGLHPWRANAEPAEPLLALMDNHREQLAAVGEIGLDAKAEVPMTTQVAVFRQFLAFALEAHLPVSVHSRGAHAEVLEELQAAGVRQGVFHWFSGPKEALHDLLAAGLAISAAPAAAVSLRHQHRIRETPLARLVVESDCPEPWSNGPPSEPAAARTALRAAAEITGLSPTELARITSANAMRIFPRLRAYNF